MKNICQFCKFSKSVEQNLKDLAREIQKIKKKPILNVDKKKEISELSRASVLKEGLDVELMTFKDTVSEKKRGDVDYIKCSNSQHLIDLRTGTLLTAEKKFIVHKYYFTCPHFKEIE